MNLNLFKLRFKLNYMEKPETKKENAQESQEEKEISLKEERVRRICLAYYARADIRKAMFEFSKHRECVPRYFEGFGKRPDSFQYDSDILELAKKGATSFHCSEELWKDPLELSTELKEEEIKKLRVGWDLLIDIDCKYIEYSKKAANAIILALKNNNVENIKVKFSGGKGFHIILPFKAFPEEMSGKKTLEMFPEWPRLICQYLKEESREFLEKDLYSSEDFNVLSKLKKGIRCERCKNMSEKLESITFVCPGCKTEMQNLSSTFERKRKIRCPNCHKEMAEFEKAPLYKCNTCQLDSKRNPENFNEGFERVDIFEVLGLDVILVSPRHLFRMPYSLHEKTALASVVVNPEDLLNFDMLRDADPLKVKSLNFIPDCKPGEAKELLRKSIEFKPIEKQKTLEEIKNPKNPEANKNLGNKKFNDITIKNLTPDLYPPTIQKILAGLKSDGRKRALFILLSFFKSLKLSNEEIESQINAWNIKNHEPLKSGYIKSQLIWYSRAKESRLPPNFDKLYYKEIGFPPTPEELAAKNPVSWVIKKALSRDWKNKEGGKNVRK
jgi:DNA-directed RNA polymerase subunit RPC12/RpoP